MRIGSLILALIFFGGGFWVSGRREWVAIHKTEHIVFFSRRWAGAREDLLASMKNGLSFWHKARGSVWLRGQEAHVVRVFFHGNEETGYAQYNVANNTIHLFASSLVPYSGIEHELVHALRWDYFQDQWPEGMWSSSALFWEEGVTEWLTYEIAPETSHFPRWNRSVSQVSYELLQENGVSLEFLLRQWNDFFPVCAYELYNHVGSFFEFLFSEMGEQEILQKILKPAPRNIAEFEHLTSSKLSTLEKRWKKYLLRKHGGGSVKANRAKSCLLKRIPNQAE